MTLSAPALRWTWRWAVAFVALELLLHDAHELVHIWTGRLMCGGWGTRDFNAWTLSPGCETWVPTAVGPIFSYLIIWAGVALLGSAAWRTRAAGLALVFGPKPFARLFTALMGGGDEMVVARALTGVTTRTPAVWLATVLIVAALTVPPMLLGWRALAGTPARGRWFIGLLLGPMLFELLVLLGLFNRLLAAGVLATPVVAGTPLLVAIVAAVTFAICLFTARWLVPER
jgi:hypothetical protein